MLVSVVIPVYNREFELQRAIKSVLQQTIQDFEILVVDDCSIIDLQPILKNFNDTRIKYFRLPHKGNANVCRNVGIKEAKGKYIAMLDSDDEWLPHHLENKIALIETKNADGVFGSICVDNGKRKSDRVSRPFHYKEKMINYILSDGVAQTSTYVFKAAALKQILWDETLVRHQDWDFSVRFAEKFLFVPSYDVSCVVYWEAGARRNEHFDSTIKFIEKNKKDILPRIYFEYHRQLYAYVKDKSDIAEKYKYHYKRELLRYIDVISLKDYLSAFADGKNKLSRFLLRIEFVVKVLFKR